MTKKKVGGEMLSTMAGAVEAGVPEALLAAYQESGWLDAILPLLIKYGVQIVPQLQMVLDFLKVHGTEGIAVFKTIISLGIIPQPYAGWVEEILDAIAKVIAAS